MTAIRLRSDKVVVRVTTRLRELLAGAVPPRTVIVIAIAAPIRVPGQTTIALAERVRRLAARGPRSRDVNARIHGNRVRIRVVRIRSARGPSVRVFVHNPEVNARSVLNAACAEVFPKSLPALPELPLAPRSGRQAAD